MNSLMINDLPFAEDLDRKSLAAVHGGYVNHAWNSWYGDDTSMVTGGTSPVLNGHLVTVT